MSDFDAMREQMVRDQIAARGLRSPRLLEAFRRVPRHLFLPPQAQSQAYRDGPVPIGNSQTISQPYIVALMTSLLNLQGNEVVLEIGTGSGYQAAVLSLLAREVHTIEHFSDLASQAQQRLRALGYRNVHIHVADGTLGWPPAAPYDDILVTASAPYVPPPLQEQLASGGRMVIPVGGRAGQDLQLWTREDGRLDYQSIIPVAFVPLRGQFGWPEQDEQDLPA